MKFAIKKDEDRYYLTHGYMQRGGTVIDHIRIGSFRFRLHIRFWRPFFLLCYGFHGDAHYSIYFGAY